MFKIIVLFLLLSAFELFECSVKVVFLICRVTTFLEFLETWKCQEFG